MYGQQFQQLYGQQFQQLYGQQFQQLYSQQFQQNLKSVHFMKYSVIQVDLNFKKAQHNDINRLYSRKTISGNGSSSNTEINKPNLEDSIQGSSYDCSIKKLSHENPNKVIIGNLNIDSISAKFDQFKSLMTGKPDILSNRNKNKRIIPFHSIFD